MQRKGSCGVTSVTRLEGVTRLDAAPHPPQVQQLGEGL